MIQLNQIQSWGLNVLYGGIAIIIICTSKGIKNVIIRYFNERA